MDEQTINREMRTLRWQNKQLGKQLGRAGQRIHELRCTLAESREINGKIARGHVRDLERQVENDEQTIVELRIDNERLAERIKWQVAVDKELLDKVRALEAQHVVTDARA